MLARLRLGERIGRGGMAEVFAAQLLGPAGFTKDVAVKRLLPRFAKDPIFLERFLSEARLAARLSHPNVVQIFELGHDGQDHYIVMEAVRGKSLRAAETRLAEVKEAMPLAAVLHVAQGLCAGLSHAHELFSVVHRDVSPHNVLLSFDGAVKLIDFGIARARDDERLTRDGQVLGKLRYMSPEQVRGDALDARSDVFSAGVVVYEMLVGRLPFDGGNQVQIAERIERGLRAPLREVAPQLDKALVDAVERALARELADRFATARAFGAALAAVHTTPAPSAHDVEALLHRLYPDEDSTAWPALEVRADGADATATGGLREISISSDIPERAAREPSGGETAALGETSVTVARPARRSRRWFVFGAATVTAGVVGAVIEGATRERAPAWRGVEAGVDAGVAPVERVAFADAGVRASEADTGDASGVAPVDVVTDAGVADGAVDAGAARVPKKRFGKVVIETRPWTQVSIDGRPVGMTPLSRDVTAGRHRVTLEAEGGLKRELDIVVRPSQTETLRIDLRK